MRVADRIGEVNASESLELVWTISHWLCFPGRDPFCGGRATAWKEMVDESEGRKGKETQERNERLVAEEHREQPK